MTTLIQNVQMGNVVLAGNVMVLLAGVKLHIVMIYTPKEPALIIAEVLSLTVVRMIRPWS